MGVPRFLEFAQGYRSPLESLGAGLSSGVQTGESVFQAASEAKLRKAQTEKMQAQAKDPLGGMQLTGPAGAYNSYLKLRATLPEGSPERDSLDKAWGTQQNLANARNTYYSTNAGYRGLTPEQKSQIQLEIQHRTGLPLSQVLKMLSFKGGVYSQPGFTSQMGGPVLPQPKQQGSAPDAGQSPTQQKYNEILGRGDLTLAQEAMQYGMGLAQYKNYLKTQLGAE